MCEKTTNSFHQTYKHLKKYFMILCYWNFVKNNSFKKNVMKLKRTCLGVCTVFQHIRLKHEFVSFVKIILYESYYINLKSEYNR